MVVSYARSHSPGATVAPGPCAALSAWLSIICRTWSDTDEHRMRETPGDASQRPSVSRAFAGLREHIALFAQRTNCTSVRQTEMNAMHAVSQSIPSHNTAIA